MIDQAASTGAGIRIRRIEAAKHRGARGVSASFAAALAGLPSLSWVLCDRLPVAALYDIHGNLPALGAVLAELAREGVSTVVVGGDVAAGPLPRETIEQLMALGDHARFVRGNADREIVDAYDHGRLDIEGEHEPRCARLRLLLRGSPATSETFWPVSRPASC